MNKYAIGKNIKLYCRMQNKTLDQLAEEIGVSRDTMSRWCNGHRQITSHGLYRVSRALRVPMERLMEGIEDKLPSAQPAFDARDTQYNLPIGKDLISRAEAIDALDCINGVEEVLRSIPTAQPEIIRCRECKFASGDSRICMKFDHSPIGELDFCAWAERRTDG